MWQGCWPFSHHRWVAESCWWGRSWTGKKSAWGCFQQWYDPVDWEESFILNLYKGKGEALDCGNYMYDGLKLTDQVMKLLERMLDSSIHQMVNIDEMQFAFVPGRGTTDAIFIVCQLQEKYIAAANSRVWTNRLCMSSRVCTTMPGAVCGSMVNTVMSSAWELVCIRALSLVHCSSSWCCKRCRVNSPLVCHGSFSMLITWCSSQTPRKSVSPSSRHGRLAWKVKGSVLTKFMVSAVDLNVLQKSGKYACAICCKGVGNNSIECLQCKLWVHKRCSGITGRLVNIRNYIWPRCKGNSRPIDGRPMTQVDVEGTKLDVEDTLCYLGDMLSSGGGCDSAIASRCVWPGESLQIYCLSSPPGTSLLGYVAKYTQTVSARLCSMVAKGGVRTSCTLNCSAAITTPWSAGSVAPKLCWNILSPTTPDTWH